MTDSCKHGGSPSPRSPLRHERGGLNRTMVIGTTSVSAALAFLVRYTHNTHSLSSCFYIIDAFLS